MTAPLILASNTISGEYEVANSLRFDAGSSDNLSQTQSSGETKTFTYSCWFKKNRDLGSTDQDAIFTVGENNTNDFLIYFLQAEDKIDIIVRDSSTIRGRLTTNRKFRDYSAWMHIVFAYDSTNATAGNRMRLYINGVEETSFATDTNPGLNQTTVVNNSSYTMRIGRLRTDARYLSGYLAECVLIDGTALDATSFGEFDSDTNIWKPIDVSGLTFGNNGFYLDFEDSSALGNDVSGNDNDFTVNNLTSIDQTTDTCTNNFCTFNSIVNAAGNNLTLSEGNLKVSSGDNNWNSAIGTFAVNSGKWYWEVKIINATNNYNHGVFSLDTGDINNTSNPMNQTGYSGFYNTDGGETRIDDTVSTSDFGTFSANDILGFYLNADDNQFTIYKNGSSHVSATNLGTGRTDLVPIAVHYNGGVSEYNFGNPPFSISSGNSDANGYGNFEYSPTIGGVNYYALNSKNLAEYG